MALPLEILALNRMAFGPRPGDAERVRGMGLVAYVDEQLHPSDADDALCDRHLKSARIHIQYDAGQDAQQHDYPAMNEDRLLNCIDQSPADLWKLLDPNIARPNDERNRPMQELRAATYLRAVYSKWQLREVLADFWHNHFNVDASMDDWRVRVLFPAYDRDVIRKHALGNFRQFLEAVATSVPMLAYLDNATSRSSPANENFARELLEQHTLGGSAYYNRIYNRWREVPGATEGKAIGYIDQDVYEAARAFTGWTIADGTDSERGETFPNTGEFHYCEAWHDNYQKRVLGVEFEPNQPPLADGRKVLDLLAAHPATANHICTKLCRRLVADNPSPELVNQAVATWTAARDKPDQIAQTVHTILLSKEFADSSGKKIKRPFELVVSFLRATEADVRVGDGLFKIAEQMGQRLFAWPTPGGHPDDAGHWLGAGTMLGRWNMPLALLNDSGTALFRLGRTTPIEVSWRDICKFWTDRMLGRSLPDASFDRILKELAGDENPDQPLALSEKDLIDRVQGLVALIAMTPEFQER